MTNRSEIIYKIFDKCEEYPKEYFYDKKLCQNIIYPLIICLSDEELIQMYWECVDEKRIIKRVESVIKSRILENGYENFIEFTEQIYQNLLEYNWNKYRRVRTFLSEIITSFSQEQISKFFNYFYNREKHSDHHKAYGVAKMIWSEEVEEILWEGLYKDQDSICLETLIERGNINRLSEIFKEVWDHSQISFRHKNSLLKRLAKENFKEVLFLKKVSPVSYMYAVILSENKLNKEEALRLPLKAKNHREFGFALWCLGKLKMWETLIELNKKVPSMQKQFDVAEAKKFGITDLHSFDD